MKIRKMFIAFLLLISLVIIPLEAQAQEGGAIVRAGQDIQILEGETYDAVIGIGNNINIAGTIRDAVVVIGGNIETTGDVGDAIVLIGANAHIKKDLSGNIVAIGTNITIDPDVSIKGDVVGIGSNLIKGENVIISGSQVDVGIGNLFDNIGLWGPPLLTIILGLLLFGSLIFALLILLAGLIFPTGIERSKNYVFDYPGKCFLVGLILFIFFLPINFILLISIIGITLLPLLWLIYGVLAIWGISVIAKIIGTKILSTLNYQGKSDALPLFLGIFSIYLLAFIPVVGWLIILLIKIMAFGISLLTHLGFRECTDKATH